MNRVVNPVKLCLANLDRLPDGVADPGYDALVAQSRASFISASATSIAPTRWSTWTGSSSRAAISTGRSSAPGSRPYDAEQRRRLAAQDWLTTVVDLSADGSSARVVGSMIDFCEVRAEAIIARLADPAIRIVSLTITEGGYYIDATTGGFDADHPEIRHDAEASWRSREPCSACCSRRSGSVAPGASRRLPCSPATTCPTTATSPGGPCSASQAWSRSDQHDWIAATVAFPNAMVDCITPATSERERELLADRFGLDDAAPVVCEPFRQWVIEDNFPQGSPGAGARRRAVRGAT